jgi:hypothetical protein
MSACRILGACVLGASLLLPTGCSPPGPAPSAPGIAYVSDASRFKRDGDPRLSPAERKAIAVARGALRRSFGRPVDAELSVAESPTGYQVNFTGLRTMTEGGQWAREPEGFGEVFLSGDLRVLRVDRGP